MDQSTRRPFASRLLPNLDAQTIVLRIQDLVYGERREHRRTLLLADSTNEALFINGILRRMDVHKIDAPYEPSKAWIDNVVKDDSVQAICMPLYVASVGIDLGMYDTLVFLACPINSQDLIQAASRIARRFREDDLSFKRWYTMYDANQHHMDAPGRQANVEWMSNFLSYTYGRHYHVIAADTSEEAEA